MPAPPDLRKFELPAPFARLRDYWNGLRIDGALPQRAHIAPRQIADLLDCTFLIERIAPAIARVRVAGMRLSDVLGMDLRGMPLSALIVPQDREAFAEELEVAFTSPAQVEIWLRSDWGVGRPSLDARMIFLPVLGDSGLADRAIGHVILTGDVGRAPRRFALRGAVALPIATTAPLAPLPQMPGARRAMAGAMPAMDALSLLQATHARPVAMPGAVLSAAGPNSGQASGARRSHLRLVVRNDP